MKKKGQKSENQRHVGGQRRRGFIDRTHSLGSESSLTQYAAISHKSDILAIVLSHLSFLAGSDEDFRLSSRC